ncbi:MAG: sugar transferase [Chitinivibrionales bacterium]|nr:sugar transferase [Chitinivibrionales bacterium]
MANTDTITATILPGETISGQQNRHYDFEYQPLKSVASLSPAIMSEQVFMHLLAAERKRTDRTGVPFVLALIDIKEIARRQNKFSFFQAKSLGHRSFHTKIWEAIASSCREVDIKGWYKSHRTLGIIFINCDAPAKKVVSEKIRNSLREKIPLLREENIRIECISYPRDNDKEPHESSICEKLFYPDVTAKPLSKKAPIALFDIVGSLLCILLFSPVFVIVAAIIKLTSAGPVIFAQERIGIGGKKFTVYKFRTMYTNNDESIHRAYINKFITNNDAHTTEGDTKIYKMQHDPRITPVGRFIRKVSLDELPQFFNVLRGDMSLVGPRPSLAYEVAIYKTWHRARVLETKPGITGFWQVEGRSLTNFDEMVRMDIRYIKKRSFWWDIKLLLKTPLVMISTRGAF